MKPTDRYVGCLVGTAVGDSLLLPSEGLSRKRIARRFKDPLCQGFVFGRGMISDDTDHFFSSLAVWLLSQIIRKNLFDVLLGDCAGGYCAFQAVVERLLGKRSFDSGSVGRQIALAFLRVAMVPVCEPPSSALYSPTMR